MSAPKPAPDLHLLAKASALYRALKELLEAFEISDEDMDVWEYDTIVDNAKANARRALRLSKLETESVSDERDGCGSEAKLSA